MPSRKPTKRTKKPPQPRAKPAAAAALPAHPDDVAMAALELPCTSSAEFVPINVLIQYQEFVAEYLSHGNAAKAARDAGFRAGTEAGQKNVATRLLENNTVREILTRQWQALQAKFRVTPERIWEELTHMAMLDPAEAFNEDGTVKQMHDIPEPVRRALTAYEIEERTFGETTVVTRRVKFAGKEGGIEKLMKLHGMMRDDRLVILNGDDFINAMNEGLSRVQRGKAKAEEARGRIISEQ